jgi:TRAP-type mannitol/chloroaromatic compound transport system substrate-binding protein
LFESALLVDLFCHGHSRQVWPTPTLLARADEVNEDTVKILKFDDSSLKVMLTISKDVVAEIGSGDELSKKIYISKKIYMSYEQFRASIMDWSDIAQRAFLNSRSLA